MPDLMKIFEGEDRNQEKLICCNEIFLADN